MGSKQNRKTVKCLLFLLLIQAATVCTSREEIRISVAEATRLSLELSEKPGYFDTDNLISNEDSYQHVVPLLKQLCPSGAYLGVGPDQNFTYIAQLRPRLAFILDVRRENLLLMAYLKSLLVNAGSRWDYLSRLLGRPLPTGFTPSAGADATELTAFFRDLPVSETYFLQEFETNWRNLRSANAGLVSDQDRKWLYQLVRPFFDYGLQLRFSSHGRPPRTHYPTLHRLITETDRDGNQWNYLNRAEDFFFLRELMAQNRVIPVIGDLAGDKSLKLIGRYLDRLDLEVSAFYVSNVEFYLMRQGRHQKFLNNLGALPLNKHSMLLRSYFGYGVRHPESMPGYLVSSVAQPIQPFLRENQRAPFRSYSDIVLRRYPGARPE